MRQMNWSNRTRNENDHMGGNSETRKTESPGDWTIAVTPGAPFRHMRIRCAGLSHVTEVPSIDRVSDQFIERGGEIARPRFDIPGVGSLISCRDTVGQIFSFLEMEEPIRPEMISLNAYNQRPPV